MLALHNILQVSHFTCLESFISSVKLVFDKISMKIQKAQMSLPMVRTGYLLVNVRVSLLHINALCVTLQLRNIAKEGGRYGWGTGY